MKIKFSKLQIIFISMLGSLILTSTVIAAVLKDKAILASGSIKKAVNIAGDFGLSENPGSLPTINDIDLSQYDKALYEITNSKITLSWQGRMFSPSQNDLKTFVDQTSDGGKLQTKLNEKLIQKYITKIARQLDRKPRNRKVSTDGELLTDGETGLKLNQTKTKLDLVNAINRGGGISNLEVEELIFSEQTIAVSTNTTGKFIEINLDEQTMYVYENGKLIRHYTVSTGKWNTPTPHGTFNINSKHNVAYSASYKLYMPNWMAFLGSEYGIHGLPYRGSWVEGQDHLGTPVSHGCIRLSWANAEELFNWADVGTTVQIN